ncbi:MAG: 30S ribosome-binding factor RbfA [Clostridia bacterium]|nr:30S ribosome-binding factor RbfA [Clostridia bacterium]
MSRGRALRVADAMREELGRIVQNELKDPRIGFASILRVDVSDDLRHARVHVSVLGDEQARKDTLRALEGARGFLRGEVARRLRLRVAPELVFVADTSIEYGVRISELLRELQGEPAERADDDRSP